MQMAKYTFTIIASSVLAIVLVGSQVCDLHCSFNGCAKIAVKPVKAESESGHCHKQTSEPKPEAPTPCPGHVETTDITKPSPPVTYTADETQAVLVPHTLWPTVSGFSQPVAAPADASLPLRSPPAYTVLRI